MPRGSQSCPKTSNSPDGSGENEHEDHKSSLQLSGPFQGQTNPPKEKYPQKVMAPTFPIDYNVNAANVGATLPRCIQ